MHKVPVSKKNSFIIYIVPTINVLDNVCKQLAPCRNGGVCVVSSNHFKCHCTGTGFYGKRCDKGKQAK